MPGLKIQPGLPDWLGDGSAVQSLLADSTTNFDSRKDTKASSIAAPRRTIAMRDSEAFVAIGKEVRCADLKVLKAQSEKGIEADFKVGHKEVIKPGDLSFEILSCKGSRHINRL